MVLRTIMAFSKAEKWASYIACRWQRTDLDAELSTMLANDIDIKLMGYVPNLIDAYRGTRVALAPIFKSYGYINKVAEAFSVGLCQL